MQMYAHPDRPGTKIRKNCRRIESLVKKITGAYPTSFACTAYDHQLLIAAKRIIWSYLRVCWDIFTRHVPLVDSSTMAKCHEIDAEITH